jgi:hypothetical protein
MREGAQASSVEPKDRAARAIALRLLAAAAALAAGIAAIVVAVLLVHSTIVG